MQDPRGALEQMLYLGMGGRCGEGAAELFEARPRRRRGDRRADISGRRVLKWRGCGRRGGGVNKSLAAASLPAPR